MRAREHIGGRSTTLFVRNYDFFFERIHHDRGKVR
jgi:hypothetical protein